MKHGSLFSGIGGFDLAAEWMGWENKFHCEWNPFGQTILKHYWPNAKSYEDITKTDFTVHTNEIDILTGGFPCQPYSSAGKRLGKEDERHLWPHMLRAISEIKPSWVVGENVRGLVNWNEGLVFHEVQSELESQGYEVQPFLIPAAGINAPHQRYRVWFIAHTNNEMSIGEKDNIKRWEDSKYKSYNRNEIWDNIRTISGEQDVANTSNKGLQRSKINGGTDQFGEKREKFTTRFFPSDFKEFPTVSPICIGDDGIPNGLDNITFSKWRKESIKAGGNAIVPHVALQIFKSIQDFEDIKRGNFFCP